jgi:hypothetical protein
MGEMSADYPGGDAFTIKGTRIIAPAFAQQEKGRMR